MRAIAVVVIYLITAAQTPSFQPLLPANNEILNFGPKAILFIRTDLEESFPPIEELASDEVIAEAVEYANAVFTRSSGGRFTIDSFAVHPETMTPDPDAVSHWRKGVSIRDQVNETSNLCPADEIIDGVQVRVLGEYDICVVVFDGLGGTTGGGGLTVVGFFGSNQNHVLTHELAHVLTASHSNFLTRNNGNVEYAHQFDFVMGGSNAYYFQDDTDVYISTYHRVELGWLDFQSHVIVVDSPGQYEIFAGDHPDSEGRPLGLLFYVPDDTLKNSQVTRDYFYFVDLRQQRPSITDAERLRYLDDAIVLQLGYRFRASGTWGDVQLLDSKSYSILGVSDRNTVDDAIDAPLGVNRRMWLKGSDFIIQPREIRDNNGHLSVVIDVGLMEEIQCGERTFQVGEECDGGLNCTDDCKAETNFEPDFPWSASAISSCGNGRRDDGEQCDSGTGCSACECLPGYRLSSFPWDNSCMTAKSTCGNGFLDVREQCDGGVGCDACMCEPGYKPAGAVDCEPISDCNDGIKEFSEACDSSEGCSLECVCELGYELDVLHPELECQFTELNFTPVPEDTEPPQIAITSPIDGSLVKARSTQQIEVSASDNVGVNRVEIRVNGSSLDCPAFPCAWRVPGGNRKPYTVSATAFDGAGLSDNHTITVTSHNKRQ